jgi:hypothetical protein
MAELDLSKLPSGALNYGDQDENGIDLSLIRSNLQLTPEQRLRLGDQARRQALQLQEYGRLHREKSARANR